MQASVQRDKNGAFARPEKMSPQHFNNPMHRSIRRSKGAYNSANIQSVVAKLSGYERKQYLNAINATPPDKDKIAWYRGLAERRAAVVTPDPEGKIISEVPYRLRNVARILLGG